MAKDPAITILHVDDNETNRYVVHRMLQNAGFKVMEAATGKAGLQIISDKNPDLVILDVKLPDINGFDVCNQIKSNPATAFIPVLHLSASFVGSQDKAQGLDSGADGYLAQPVEPVELIATVRSLLRIRQAEESALALAEEWQTTFDSISDGVGLLDREGRFQRCNRALMELLNKPVNEINGCFHEKLIQTALDCNYPTPFSRVQETQQRESQEINCSGRWFAVTVDPVFAQNGTLAGAVYILADITNKRRAEESLRYLAEASKVLASTLDYKTTLNNIVRLAVPTLADFCFFDVVAADERVHRAAWHHRESDRSEWFDRVQRFVPPQHLKDHPVAQVFTTGKAAFIPEVTDEWLQSVAISPEHLQFMQELQFGSLITVPLILRQQKLGALTFCLLAKSGRHYTLGELHLAEELAHRAAVAVENAKLYQEAQDANRMKDEFLATLSHELRSPLNAMLGWTRLLNTRKFDEATTAKAMQTIERSARSQAQLVEDLLDVSRIIQGKLRLNVRPIQLIPVLEAAIDTVRPAAEAKEIRIQTVLDPLTGSVAGDSDRLQQVIWNLLSNAIKFTPKGGRVHIRLERVNSHIEINISDTGQGISSDFVPYVFDRFRQADSSITRTYSGLGLGLAIVRHLVELHGGTVRAESEGLGKGATFTVKLPLIPVQIEANNQERVHPAVSKGVPFDNPPSLEGLVVLVVDDEPDARDYLVAVLEACRAEVVTATSAIEAIERLSEIKPNVLVSDIGMPQEDGYTLISKVRELSASQGGQIPAVALTAYARAEDRTKAIAAGFQLHIPKPVEPAELVTVVASLAKRNTNFNPK